MMAATAGPATACTRRAVARKVPASTAVGPKGPSSRSAPAAIHAAAPDWCSARPRGRIPATRKIVRHSMAWYARSIVRTPSSTITTAPRRRIAPSACGKRIPTARAATRVTRAAPIFHRESVGSPTPPPRTMSSSLRRTRSRSSRGPCRSNASPSSNGRSPTPERIGRSPRHTASTLMPKRSPKRTSRSVRPCSGERGGMTASTITLSRVSWVPDGPSSARGSSRPAKASSGGSSSRPMSSSTSPSASRKSAPGSATRWRPAGPR